MVRKKGKKPFNDAFSHLRERVVVPVERSGEIPERKPDPAPVPAIEDDQVLLARELAGVRPLESKNFVIKRRPEVEPGHRDDDAEAMAELADLVDGGGGFDMRWSLEHVEGVAPSVDRRLLRRLRRGEFSFAAHLDLHGLTRAEARPRVESFLRDSRLRGHRCVLIVHGRGLNSKDGIPVLKESLKQWLTRGVIGRAVLAFSSARPCDGGLGAVYILLRK